jgi:uncharacterized protein (TIGR02611 family)
MKMLFRRNDRIPTTQRGSFRVELRRIAIGIAGFGVLLLGLVLVFVPVPGTSIVVIPLGLAILAKEFVWAKRTLAWLRQSAQAVRTAVRQHFGYPAVLAKAIATTVA